MVVLERKHLPSFPPFILPREKEWPKLVSRPACCQQGSMCQQPLPTCGLSLSLWPPLSREMTSLQLSLLTSPPRCKPAGEGPVPAGKHQCASHCFTRTKLVNTTQDTRTEKGLLDLRPSYVLQSSFTSNQAVIWLSYSYMYFSVIQNLREECDSVKPQQLAIVKSQNSSIFTSGRNLRDHAK